MCGGDECAGGLGAPSKETPSITRFFGRGAPPNLRFTHNSFNRDPEEIAVFGIF